MHKKMKIAVALAAVAAFGLTSCAGPGATSSGSQQGAATIKIAYEKTDAFTALDTLLQTAKTEFEAAHKGVTVQLQPIAGTDDDYKTKLALSQRSASTAPDVFYEDTSNVRADADAGYLLKLDDYLAKWADWSKFNEGAKAAGQGADGTYAVSLGTDTRVIWYSKPVFEKAGIATPWQPKTWADIMAAAKKIKAAEPGVVPFNLYAGTGTGEGTVMQGFYELLYGTDLGANALYDSGAEKWVVGSKGFTDSLNFVKSLYDDKLAVSTADALDPNVWKKVFGEWFPKAKLGATVEGSYTPSFWQDGGAYPWPDYTKDMGVALFPTQNGQAPGGVSMSGGWTLAVGAKSKNPQLAFDFLTTALSKDNALSYDTKNSQIAVRTDVASDPTYLAANPFVADVTKAVDVTHFRPSTSDYTKVSAEVQKATEAVITGTSAADAAKAYDAAVTSIVGADNTVTK